MKLQPGFNEDISNENYHNDREYKSSSALKLILKDPREYYRKYVLNEQDSMNKDSLNIGSYFHTRILEPHLLDKEYAIFTGKSRRGKEWEEFEASAEGKTIITSSQKYLVDNMVEKFEQASVKIGNADNEKEVLISSFFNGGKAEETLCGEIDGYKVKVRFDYRKEFEDFGSINDLKTTAGSVANKAEVQEICEYWGYHLSAALYVDLVTQVTGKSHDFYFVFSSKKDGECRIFKASEAMLERGRKEYKEAIRLLKEAEATNIYFQNKIEELD